MEDVTQGKERLPIPGPVGANCFKYVKTNVPGRGFAQDEFTEEFAGCSCVEKCAERACPCVQLFGPTYDDQGRLLEIWCSGEKNSCRSIFECGDNCDCKSGFCRLRVVQKGILLKLRVFETKTRGYGLTSVEEIKRLSFVCEYAGEVIDENEAKLRLERNQCQGLMNFLIALQEHTSVNTHNVYVDPCDIGNIGRFINHSCDPNLIMIPVRVNHPVPRLALFARQDIVAGEELTFDYSGVTTLNKSETDTTHTSKSETDTTNTGCLSQPERAKSSPFKSDSDSHFDVFNTNLPFTKDGIIDQASIQRKEKLKQNHDNRTKCLCGSKNCAVYLPYDEHLFDNAMNKS